MKKNLLKAAKAAVVFVGVAMSCQASLAALAQIKLGEGEQIGTQHARPDGFIAAKTPSLILSSLQFTKGVVATVDASNGEVITKDGRRLTVGPKTQVFRNGQKGSIYSIGTGLRIEFAIKPEDERKATPAHRGAPVAAAPATVIHVYTSGSNK